MKNKISLIFYLLLLTVCSISQSQWTEQWVKGIPCTLSTGEPSLIKLHQDELNNLYVSVSNLNSNYPYSPTFHFFKLDSAGQQQWSKTGNAFITGVVFDKSNATYVSGIYSGTVNVFGNALISKGGKDIYLAKLDPAGNSIWMKSFGGPGNDESGGLIITEKQELVLTGTVRNDPDFNDTLIASDIRCKPFMGLIDTDGIVEHVKTWDADVYLTNDTNYSRLEFVEPIMDSKESIYALWKMTDIQVDTEIGSILGWPTSWSFQFYLLKFDSLLRVTGANHLGDDYMKNYSGLKIDHEDRPFILYSSSSQYSGSGTRILRFDSLLNLNKTFLTPLISELPYCNYRYKSLSAMDFDASNNIITCSHDQCDYYGSSPAQQDQHLVIQSFDTTGSQFALIEYDLNNKRVFPYDIQLTRDKMDFYVGGYADSIFEFNTDSIGPMSVFVMKYSSVLTSGQDEQHFPYMSIYPNPSSGKFTIINSYQSTCSIAIYDVLGNCIIDKTPLQNNEHHIDLNSQPKGIYFVEIMSENQKTVKKISLQ